MRTSWDGWAKNLVDAVLEVGPSWAGPGLGGGCRVGMRPKLSPLCLMIHSQVREAQLLGEGQRARTCTHGPEYLGDGRAGGWCTGEAGIAWPSTHPSVSVSTVPVFSGQQHHARGVSASTVGPREEEL